MPDAAAQNLAQHISAPLVRRQHAVIDEKGRGARVIGDDAQAGVATSVRLLRERTSVSSAARSISGVNKSVSKLLTLPCSTAATRSSPMPVSIEGLGNGSVCSPSSCQKHPQAPSDRTA